MKLSELHELIVDGTRKLKIKKGDVSFLNITGIGHIPVMVAKDNFGRDKNVFIIYVYNIILKSKEEPFTLNKNDLLIPPTQVLRNNWSKGLGFEYRYSLKPEDIDVFTNHCFKMDGAEIYFDENRNRCERFEPCAPDEWRNITTISMSIMKKLKGITIDPASLKW